MNDPLHEAGGLAAQLERLEGMRQALHASDEPDHGAIDSYALDSHDVAILLRDAGDLESAVRILGDGVAAMEPGRSCDDDHCCLADRHFQYSIDLARWEHEAGRTDVAVERLRALQNPREDRDEIDAVRLWHALGEMLGDRGDAEGRAEAWTKAVLEAERLAANSWNDLLRDLARTMRNAVAATLDAAAASDAERVRVPQINEFIAQALEYEARCFDAAEAWRAAAGEWLAIADREQSDRARLAAVVCLRERAASLHHSNHNPSALKELDHASEILDTLPESTETTEVRASLWWMRGEIHEGRDDREAERAYRTGFALAPDDATTSMPVVRAYALRDGGRVLATCGTVDEALAWMDRAAAILHGLDGDHSQNRDAHAHVLWSRAMVLREAGDSARAAATLLEAAAIHETAAAKGIEADTWHLMHLAWREVPLLVDAGELRAAARLATMALTDRARQFYPEEFEDQVDDLCELPVEVRDAITTLEPELAKLLAHC